MEENKQDVFGQPAEETNNLETKDAATEQTILEETTKATVIPKARTPRATRTTKKAETVVETPIAEENQEIEIDNQEGEVLIEETIYITQEQPKETKKKKSKKLKEKAKKSKAKQKAKAKKAKKAKKDKAKKAKLKAKAKEKKAKAKANKAKKNKKNKSKKK
jgi:hypothetical protein